MNQMKCSRCPNVIRLTASDDPAFKEGSHYPCRECGERNLFNEGRLVSVGQRQISGIEALVDRCYAERIAAASPQWDADERQWIY
jgi:DNA-directed RNA polymerase subunit RPC12/RpoP